MTGRSLRLVLMLSLALAATAFAEIPCRDYVSGPVPLHTVNLGSAVEEIQVIGSTAYVATANDRLHVFEVTGTRLRRTEVIEGVSVAGQLVPKGDYAVVPLHGHEIGVLDVSDPLHPFLATRTDLIGVRDLFWEGNRIYAACGTAGFAQIDATDPLNLDVISRLALIDSVTAVAAYEGVVGLATGTDKIRILDTNVPSARVPIPAGSLTIPRAATDIMVHDGTFLMKTFSPQVLAVENLSVEGPNTISVYDLPSIMIDFTSRLGELWVMSMTRGVFHVEFNDGDVWSGPAYFEHFFMPEVIVAENGFLVGDGYDVHYYDSAAEPPLASLLDFEVRPDHAVASRDVTCIVKSRDLILIDTSDPSDPRMGVTFRPPDNVWFSVRDVAMLDGDLLVVRSGSRLLCYDVSDPMSPSVVSDVIMPWTTFHFTAEGSTVWFLTENRVKRVDYTDPVSPVEQDMGFVGLGYTWIRYDEGRIYLRNENINGVRVFRIDADALTSLGQINVPVDEFFEVDGGVGFRTDMQTVLVLDVTQVPSTFVASEITLRSFPSAIAVDRPNVFISTQWSGCEIHDVTDLNNPVKVGFVSPVDEAISVMIRDDVIIFPEADGELRIAQNVCNSGDPGCSWSYGDLTAQDLQGGVSTWVDDDGRPDLVGYGNGTAPLYMNGPGGVLTQDGSVDVGALDVRSMCASPIAPDGPVHVYAVASGGANRLYEIQGDGSFVDVTTPPLDDAGDGRAAAWFDADLDGLADLYLVNAGGANRLFMNQGGGVFAEAGDPVAADAGDGRAVAIGDYDDDGDQDLYVVNADLNRMLRNDGGSFTDVSTTALADPGDGTSAAWGDADRDGDLDLYLGNAGGVNRFFRNEEGTLVDDNRGPLAGNDDTRDVRWLDVELDGDLDLVLANDLQEPLVLLNNGAGDFNSESCPMITGTNSPTGLVPADWDIDGDPEYVVTSAAADVRMVDNDNWRSMHRLRIRLYGDESNEHGLGARVRIHAGGNWIMREMTDGSGGPSRAPHVIDFGIGTATVVDTLEVRWPSGRVGRSYDLPVDRTLLVSESDIVPTLVADQSIAVHGGRVELHWRLHDPVSGDAFRVERRDALQGWFAPVSGAPVPDGNAWTWTDAGAVPGRTYDYRVILESDGVDVELFTSSPVTIPVLRTALQANVPNPFNPATTIRFTLAEPGRAKVSVYALDGRLVTRLRDESLQAGAHEVTWHGRDGRGRAVASGSYVVRLETGKEADARRIMLLR